MTRVAAIDCGTNSIRLLIADIAGNRLVDVDRRMTVVRLGEGVDRTGVLSAAALERTFAACTDYGALIADSGAQRVRFVATSASRDAANAADFAAGVQRILGVAPEVVSGAEEASLSFTGAMRGSGLPTPALVFDIGGGSTEFILGAREPLAAASVDMGCVRFTERYGRGDPMDPGAAAALRAQVGEMLDGVEQAVPLRGARSVLGLAGTVTTVVALALGLPRYDSDRIHLASIAADDVHRVAEQLAAMTLPERQALAVMHPGRADVIVAGAMILDEIVDRSGADRLTASEHDILDGIAWSMVPGA